MNIWWLITLLLTYKSPNYPSIHYESYLVFFGGLFIFNISVFCLKSVKLSSSNPRKEYFFDIKYRRCFELLVLICYFPFVKDNIIALLQGNEFWLLRKLYGERQTTYIEEVFRVYICEPISWILFLTAYYKYYTNISNKSFRNNMLMAIIIVGVGCFSSGGRTGVINFVVLYILMCFCHLFYYYRDILNNNSKFNPIFLLIPVGVVIYMTVSRNLINDNVSIIDLLRFSYGLYGGLFDYYYCGSGSYVLNEHTYGLSTFEGIYLFINYPYKFMFDTNILDYTCVDDIIQNMVYITNSEYPVNAHVSIYFRFIRDWGIFGIVIGPLLISLLYHYFFILGSRKQIHLLLYFYSLMQINYTTFENAFSKNTFITFLIWYFIFTKLLTKAKYVYFDSNSNIQR